MSLDASSENIGPDGVKLIAKVLRKSVTGLGLLVNSETRHREEQALPGALTLGGGAPIHNEKRGKRNLHCSGHHSDCLRSACQWRADESQSLVQQILCSVTETPCQNFSALGNIFPHFESLDLTAICARCSLAVADD